MDFNDIKPPGGNGAVRGHLEELIGQAEKKPSQVFATPTNSAAQQTPPLLKAVSHLDKTVFDDPTKLDGAVRASISELIDSRRGVTGPLSNSEKQNLTDFLAADPIMRRQVEGLLRKVLT